MELIIVDIETTGFNNKSDAIVEIGISLVNTETKLITPIFNQIVKDENFNEQKHKNAWIFENTTLSINDVISAKPLESYRKEIQNLLDKYPMTAYNKSFDIRFLKERKFKLNDLKCLMSSAIKFSSYTDKNGKIKKPSAEEIYKQFFPLETSYKEEHRALQDSIDEAKILLHMISLDDKCLISEKITKTKSKKPQSNFPKYNPMGPDDTFTFGLNKGKSLKDVILKQSGYVIWCLKNVKGFKLTTAGKNLLSITKNEKKNEK